MHCKLIEIFPSTDQNNIALCTYKETPSKLRHCVVIMSKMAVNAFEIVLLM